MADILDLDKRGELDHDITLDEHDENFTRIESAVNYVHGRLEAVEAIVSPEALSGYIEAPSSRSYIVELDAAVAGAITALAHRVESGSAVLSALVDGVAVSGLSGLTCVASKQVSLPSASNVYPTGGVLALRVTNVASGTFGLAYTLRRQLGAGLLNLDAFWATGPYQRLPFWHGAYHGIDELETLAIGTDAGSYGRLDLVHAYDEPAGFADVVSATVVAWVGSAQPHHVALAAADASALLWSSSPFCSGSGTPPGTMPGSAGAVSSSTWLSAAKPPGYTGSEDEGERIQAQRDVWGIAAAGWLDDVWREKFVQFKKNYFVGQGITNVRIILRAAHQLDGPLSWGSADFVQGHNAEIISDGDGAAKINEALRRYFTIFKDVFGHVQADIPGDVIFPADRLWTMWCPLADGGWADIGESDIGDTCPENVDLIGVDLYDTNPPGATYEDFADNLDDAKANGSARGLSQWLDFALGRDKLFALGEWGAKNDTLPTPAEDGGDNPVFVRQVLQTLLERSSEVAFASYFNRNVTASSSVPGTLVGSWAGIDLPATDPASGPIPHLVNQSAARAYRSVFRGRSRHPANDVSSGLVSLCGVRLLNLSYDGPLIQVRRTSDSTTEDIGFVAATGLLDIAALQEFVGAADGEITRFYNQADPSTESLITLHSSASALRIAIGGEVTRWNGVPFPMMTAVGSPSTWYVQETASYTGDTLTGVAAYHFGGSNNDARLISLTQNFAGDTSAMTRAALILRHGTGGFVRGRRSGTLFTTSVSHGGSSRMSIVAGRFTGSEYANHCGESSGTVVSTGPFDVNRIIFGGSLNGLSTSANSGDTFGEWAVWHSDVGVEVIDAAIRNTRGYLDGY